MPLVVVTLVLLFMMPVSCRLEGNYVVMHTPAETAWALLLEEPRIVKGKLCPPAGSRPFFCYGYRALTFNADCGDEFFFSTPNCDGNWLVAKARIGQERKNLWICGCKS